MKGLDAHGVVPRRDTYYVTTSWKLTMAAIPQIMGTVNRTKWRFMGPVLRSVRVLLMCFSGRCRGGFIARNPLIRKGFHLFS